MLKRIASLGVVLMLAVAPAQAAFDIFNLKSSLVQFLLDQISTPDFTVTAEEVESPGEGRTVLRGVAIADRNGIWFEAERMSLQWNAERILRAELEINELAAAGVRVLRAPEGEVAVKEDAAIAEDDGEPFDWPRAPIATRVERLALERVFVAAGVIAEQSIAFDAEGSARDEGDEQAVALTVRRTDAVAGRIAVDYLRDFAAGTLRANLTADEAAGGLVAELAGFPEDSASRLALSADGPLTAWHARIEAATDRVFDAAGRAEIDLEAPVAVAAELRIRPGPAMEPTLAGLLGREARLDLDVAETGEGVIEIREGRVASPALTLAAEGSYRRATGEAALDVELDGAAALADLAEGVAFEAIGFTGRVEGRAGGGAETDLTARGALSLEGLATAPADLGSARLATEVRIEGSRIAYDVEGTAHTIRLDRIGPELLGSAELAAAGVYDGERATLDRLRFASRPLAAEAAGAVDVAADTAALDYRLSAPELGPLAAAYGAEATGAARISGRLEGPLAAPRLTGEAALEDLSYQGKGYGQVRLDHDVTLGESPAGAVDLAATGSPYGPVAVKTRFALEAEVLRLRRMTAEALGAQIAGNAAYDLGSGLAEGRITLEAPDLAPMAALAGAEVAGAEVAGAVSGRLRLAKIEGTQRVDLALEGREIAAAGLAVERMELGGRLEDALARPTLDARLRLAQVRYADARIETVEGQVAATDLTGTATAEFDLALTGAAGFGARAARLTLAGTATDLARLASLEARLDAEELGYDAIALGRLGADITGAELLAPIPELAVEAEAQAIAGYGARLARADLAAKLTATDGRADLEARLATGPVTAPGARIARLTLDAALADALGPDPAIEADLETGAIEAEPARLSKLTATARGALSAIEARLSTGGTLEDDPIALEGAARIDATATPQRIRVSRLEARLAEETARLARPLAITLGDSMRFEGLDLALPGGGLSGSAALHPDGLGADLALSLADLGDLRRLAGLPVTAGSVEAEARLDTRPGRASGRVEIAAPGLKFERALADIGALALTASTRWDGRRAETEAALAGPFARPVRARLGLALRPTGGPLPAVPAGAEIDGAVRWRGAIDELWVLVPAPDHVLAGALDLDLALSGTLAEPEIGGTVTLAEGRYENLMTGTILTELSLGSRVDPDGAFVLEARAEDGAEGRVSAEAALSDGRLEATLTAQEAVLVRRDDVTAALGLDLAAAGPLAGPDLSGTITVEKAEIRLVNATPPSVVTLEDVRIAGAPPPEEEEPAGEEIGLDLRIRGDRDIFVRGRGLTSEWRIDMAVSGTAAAPRVTGEIARVRGRLDFLGTPFDLTKGQVRFQGGAQVDPRLDVELTAEQNDIRGGIAVEGTASDPEIRFFSRPSLPEDEVLPRLLFGRSSQSLSASQGIRLASGLATLLDGTGGFLDRGRAAVGLDVLAVDPTDSGDGATLTLGKNIGDDVFVGAKQSLDGAETSVTVEVEVFENVTVDGEVDQNGEQSVGVNWKRDF